MDIIDVVEHCDLWSLAASSATERQKAIRVFQFGICMPLRSGYHYHCRGCGKLALVGRYLRGVGVLWQGVRKHRPQRKCEMRHHLTACLLERNNQWGDEAPVKDDP